MHYVMSDLHGRYDLFLQMLERIRLSKEDTLYLLGDMIDRGPDGIQILQDIRNRSNVVPFFGNHEDMFYRVIRMLGRRCTPEEKTAVTETMVNWIVNNGGNTTWASYRDLTEPERKAILEYLETFTVYQEVEVDGTVFFLSHAGVGAWAPEKDPESCTLHDFIWAEMDYDKIYYKDKYLVTGHTPTDLIDPAFTGRIIRKNNHIAIDCGAVFCGTLGCFCLDTLEEVYVSSGDRRHSESGASNDISI